jgi:hypothetical protein
MADADHRTGAVALARKVSMRDFSGEVVIQKGKAPRAYGPNLGRSPCWNSGDALYSHRSINHGLRAMFVETFIVLCATLAEATNPVAWANMPSDVSGGD